MAPHPDPHPRVADATAASLNSLAVPNMAEKTCLSCGQERVKQRCGGCRRVYFCDRECQKRAWRDHRPLCIPASEPAVVAEAAAVGMQAPPSSSSLAATQPVDNGVPVKDPTRASPSTKAIASALHTKKVASPKSVTLVTEPVAVLELPASADDHDNSGSNGSASKKKKKHKKKKRSNSMHAPASEKFVKPDLKNRSVSLSVRKHIMWGDVYAREYTRFPGGGGAVPYDGTWALGLGAPVADVQLGSVLDVEELREQELKSRIQELPKSKRSYVREGETRQFDYCRGIDNPLFSRLSERERKQIFIEVSAKSHSLDDEDEPRRANGSKRKGSISSSPPKHNHHANAGLRRLSLSFSDNGTSETDELETPDFACVSIEQLDEFAKIRDSREVACGCSCGDLVKKVAKMNLKRLHAFLADRDIEVTVHSKPELLALAKAVAAKEKNCSNSIECECMKNGVECHSNVCDGCVGDCWNPHSAYMYNKKQVVQYRKEQIAKWREANASRSTPSSTQQMENANHLHQSISVV